MSALQATRAVLAALAAPATFHRGVFMARRADGGLPPPPPRKDFRGAYAVVFVDASGWLNMAAHMSGSALAQARPPPLPPGRACGPALQRCLRHPAACWGFQPHVVAPLHSCSIGSSLPGARRRDGRLTRVAAARRRRRRLRAVWRCWTGRARRWTPFARCSWRGSREAPRLTPGGTCTCPRPAAPRWAATCLRGGALPTRRRGRPDSAAASCRTSRKQRPPATPRAPAGSAQRVGSEARTARAAQGGGGARGGAGGARAGHARDGRARLPAPPGAAGRPG